MHPGLNVWLDAGADPVSVQPITMDFVDYSRLIGKAEPNGFELRLTIAYLHLEEGEPKTIKDVHQWARRRSVVVEEVEEAPDPTQLDRSPA